MYNKFKKEVDDGIKGLNKGINFPLVRFNSYIPGVRKERLYLIGGGSGSGKSKVTNTLFIITAFEDWIANGKSYPLQIHYFSLEMPETQIIAEVAARWIHREHDLLVDSQYLLGHWKDHTVSPYINELLSSKAFKQYIKDFTECVTILDMKLNMINFSKYVMEKAEENGLIETKQITIKGADEPINVFKSYKENDDKQLIMFVIDHISLVKTVNIKGKSQTRKEMIDEMADIMIKSRNRFKFAFVVTQQLNRNFNSTDRVKLEDVLPKDSDFRDGSGMFDAANVVLGIMSPQRERHTSFLGFKVADTSTGPGFGNKLLVVNIVKNRHGAAFAVFPLLFLGETGELEELPNKAKDFDMDYLKRFKKYYIN